MNRMKKNKMEPCEDCAAKAKQKWWNMYDGYKEKYGDDFLTINREPISTSVLSLNEGKKIANLNKMELEGTIVRVRSEHLMSPHLKEHVHLLRTLVDTTERNYIFLNTCTITDDGDIEWIEPERIEDPEFATVH